MKKILTLMLAIAMVFLCLLATSCGEEKVTVSRSFVAGYEKTVAMGASEVQMSGRALMNLNSDGTLDLYVGFLGMGSHETAHYTGTYTLGENEEFDETISFTYTYGEGEGESATVSDAVILDSIFKTPFYMITSMTSTDVSFYETAPIGTDGDVYVGYLTKSGGMGSMVYAYALNMKEDNTFEVGIMQMASVMHVWDKSVGTYTVDGSNVTFSYDVMDGEGAVATADYTSEGKDLTETGLTCGFNVAQTTVRASDAAFIRVK